MVKHWWVPGGRTIERTGDAVCGLHHVEQDKEHRFLGSTSKQSSMGFLVWASKPATEVW
jgi:hypothetical protein